MKARALIRYITLASALTLTLGCGKSDEDSPLDNQDVESEGIDAGTDTPTIRLRGDTVVEQDLAERSTVQPLQAYELCEEDDDCGELSCVEMFGSSVCVAVGCADDETVCVSTESCVVSDAIHPEGVCALTGTSDYCGRHCRDFLVCGLDPECVTRSCCGTADGECPEACSALGAMECEIDPRCSAECCPSP